MQGRLFRTEDLDLLALWDRLLTRQANVTVGFELPAYYTSRAWHRARSVLDLGTGNGAYLRRLARVFPAKRYLGVDKSAELIDSARRAESVARVEYRCMDLFDVEGQFDFIIMRLVARHVADYGRLVALLDRLLGKGGEVLVVDSDVDHLYFWPEAPALMALFRRLDASMESQFGGGGKVLDLFTSRVRSCPGLHIAGTRKFTVPSTVAGNLDAMREQYGSTIELVRRTSDLDTAEAEEEWKAWCALPHAFTQFGMELLTIEKSL